MIDVNQNGTIDFNEFLVMVVLTNRMKDLASRLSFTFDMYVNKFVNPDEVSLCWFRWDESGDGQLDQKELANVISAIVRTIFLWCSLEVHFTVQYDRAGITDRKDDSSPKKTCQRNHRSTGSDRWSKIEQRRIHHRVGHDVFSMDGSRWHSSYLDARMILSFVDFSLRTTYDRWTLLCLERILNKTSFVHLSWKRKRTSVFNIWSHRRWMCTTFVHWHEWD